MAKCSKLFAKQVDGTGAAATMPVTLDDGLLPQVLQPVP